MPSGVAPASDPAEQARLLAAVFESSRDAILALALDGRITMWNPAAEALYGFPAAQAIGRPIELIIPSDRRTESSEILARVRSGERIRAFDTVRMRKNGERVHVSLSVSPVLGEAGRVVGISKIAREVPERTEDPDARAGQARGPHEVNESLREFAHVVSHELKAPLRGIASVAEWIREDFGDVVDDDARENLRLMQERVLRM
ncbi:MAG: PAS domain S-box protein, partial [Candidatus Eisenbacteria bacterium]|nr:PAS domain S-box protein [Candidatus Eisenbacteria bacterium]